MDQWEELSLSDSLHWFHNGRQLRTSLKMRYCEARNYLPTCVFKHFVPLTCICLRLWLVHWVISICCDWLESLLWFWFNLQQYYSRYMERDFTLKETAIILLYLFYGLYISFIFYSYLYFALFQFRTFYLIFSFYLMFFL